MRTVDELAPDLLFVRRETDLTPDLGKITCPALIISGEQDPGVSRQSQETLGAGIAESTLVVVPNSSHLVPIERATEFNVHLLNFLAWGSG